MPITSQNRALPPRRAFLRGAALGGVISLSLTALAVFLLGRAGIGDPDANISRVARFALAFAGIPAMLSAGGVARYAGRRALLCGAADRNATASAAGALAHTPAGIGLVLLTALPLGKLPEEELRWLWLAAAGAVAGALAGAIIGRLAAGAATRELAALGLERIEVVDAPEQPDEPEQPPEVEAGGAEAGDAATQDPRGQESEPADDSAAG